MIDSLVNYLKRCDEAYYNSGNAIVTDDTYDALVNSLRVMDPTNEYLSKVGAKAGNKSKVGRIIPMGTLSKYHENDEVESWINKEYSTSGGFILAPKYDGFGVELIYNNCKLISAGTRGDGNVGENIYESIVNIPSVPKELPSQFSNLKIVRGEAIIPRRNHKRMKEFGYEAMRNAVPGIVRSCNKEALPYVDFVAYEFFDGRVNREEQRYDYSSIFNVEEFTPFYSIDFESILDKRDFYGANKLTYKYEIDGTVIKTINILQDNLLNPEHQIAWKFKSNHRETVLRAVEFQMGVTGKFTPVGIFDPVEFQGAKLSRASFGSIYRYRDLDPKIGCIVEVSRRGDIIPYIEKVVTCDVPNVVDIPVFDTCPYCGEKLNPKDGSCENVHCHEKLNLQIRNYVGCLGVKGIGPSLVKGLVETGKISCLSDIYEVTDEDIISLPRQGQSSADKWKAFITKNIRLIDFLSALPFDNIGPKVWSKLLENTDVDTLLTIDTLDKFNEVFSGKDLKGIGSSKIEGFVSQMKLYGDDIRTLITKVSII